MNAETETNKNTQAKFRFRVLSVSNMVKRFLNENLHFR
jgi:hypothetical protein